MSNTDDLLRDSDRWKRSYDRHETNYATMLTARGVIGSFDSALRDALATVEQMRRERDLALEAGRNAAWQFNEAVSLLREALLHVAPGTSLIYDIEEGLPAIQEALVALARASQPVADSGEGTG